MTDKHNGKLLSADMKMAEVPDIDYRLLGVIRRLGIHFGFGEKTVEEVCSGNGINPHTLLLICKIYIHGDYAPSNDELSGSSIRDIVTYLHNSHGFYTGIAIAAIEKDITMLTGTLDSRHSHIISSFFSNYKAEIMKHFEYEELTVFPYINNLVAGKKSDSGYSIDRYEENHSDVEEKLNDLKNILMKYMPPTCDDDIIRDILTNLYILEEDLDKHTYIENEILVPMVATKEKEMRKQS